MKIHELKIWPDEFALIQSGEKRFELRRNDRDFAEGDILHLRVWDPDTQDYDKAGQDIGVVVTHLYAPILSPLTRLETSKNLEGVVDHAFVIMSIAPVAWR